MLLGNIIMLRYEKGFIVVTYNYNKPETLRRSYFLKIQKCYTKLKDIWLSLN